MRLTRLRGPNLFLADAEAPSSAELIDHVASRLAPHKRPRAVHFVDELPRNAVGKVVKQRLADP